VKYWKVSVGLVRYRVNLTDRAARDLERLYDSIHAAASEKALDWFNKLAETIYSLDRFPERGAQNPKNKTQRQLFFGNKPNVYKILYDTDKRRRVVSVVHIRHGSRTFPSK
jgi:toxin ParE1/3/4